MTQSRFQLIGKNESFDLAGKGVTMARLAGGWDPQPEHKVDVDIWAVLLDAEGFVLPEHSPLYYGSRTWPEGLNPNEQKDEAIRRGAWLSKDNTTGQNNATDTQEGNDDEHMLLNLPALKQNFGAASVLLCANIYSGQKFGELQNAFFTAQNAETREPLFQIDLSNFERYTGIVIGQIDLTTGIATAIMEGHNGSGREGQNLICRSYGVLH